MHLLDLFIDFKIFAFLAGGYVDYKDADPNWSRLFRYLEL